MGDIQGHLSRRATPSHIFAIPTPCNGRKLKTLVTNINRIQAHGVQQFTVNGRLIVTRDVAKLSGGFDTVFLKMILFPCYLHPTCRCAFSEARDLCSGPYIHNSVAAGVTYSKDAENRKNKRPNHSQIIIYSPYSCCARHTYINKD
jgi:hypothetical protein